MRPSRQLLPIIDSWDAMPASPQDAASMLRQSARMLLQANRAPASGGFQAARYFTYVFFGACRHVLCCRPWCSHCCCLPAGISLPSADTRPFSRLMCKIAAAQRWRYRWCWS